MLSKPVHCVPYDPGSLFLDSVILIINYIFVCFNMPRPKNKERKIGKHKKEDMMSALRMVQTGYSIRTAATSCKIPYPTLRRYVKNNREHGDNISLVPRYDINEVFTEEHEQILLKYYKDCALMFYGLTVK